MKLIFTQIFILMSLQSPPSGFAQPPTSPSPSSPPAPHPLHSIGIRLQPFVTISSGPQLANAKSIHLKLFWKLLSPVAAENIRNDCGKRLFLPMIKSILNNPLPSSNPDHSGLLIKSTNCSFTQDYAKVSVYHDPSSEFVMTSGRLVALSVTPYGGSDSEELCSIRLRGYEKFTTIFVAYNFIDSAKSSSINILNFPPSFAKLVNSNVVKGEVIGHRSAPSAVIFEPNLGKGKTFQKTKKCIEVLLSGKHKPFVMDVVEYFCIIECHDVEKKVKRKETKPKNKKDIQISKGKTKTKNLTNTIKTGQRIEL